jgi:hypothetical protein
MGQRERNPVRRHAASPIRLGDAHRPGQDAVHGRTMSYRGFGSKLVDDGTSSAVDIGQKGNKLTAARLLAMAVCGRARRLARPNRMGAEG